MGKEKGMHCRGKPEQSIMKCILTIYNFTVKPICLNMCQQLKEEKVKRSSYIHLSSWKVCLVEDTRKLRKILKTSAHLYPSTIIDSH